MAQLFANNAFSTLAAGISAGDASITLATGTGSRFPALSGSDVFDITLTQAGDETRWEVVRCTARTGDVLTVTRGVEGAAAAWSAGSKVEIRITAAWLNNPVKGPLTITTTGTGNSFVVEDVASDTTPFVIDANGCVIIGKGTVTPFAFTSVPRFQVSGASQATSSITAHVATGTSGLPSSVLLGRSRGDLTTQTAVSGGDDIGMLQFEAHDGTSLVPAAQILAKVDGTPGTGDMPGCIVFSTTPDGGSVPVEAMRIDSAKKVTLAGGLQIAKTAVTAPAATDGNVFSGTYMPTLTNSTNVASSTAQVCQYMLVGDVVTVSGQVSMAATTAETATALKMALPISSAMNKSSSLGGTALSSSAGQYGTIGAAIMADIVNDVAEFRLTPNVNTSVDYRFTFTYRAI